MELLKHNPPITPEQIKDYKNPHFISDDYIAMIDEDIKPEIANTYPIKISTDDVGDRRMSGTNIIMLFKADISGEEA